MATKTKFIKDFRIFLRTVDECPYADYDVQEFRRWMTEGLVPFSQVSAHEQFNDKMNYEISIGNDNPSFREIADYLNMWLERNEEQPLEHIWYHGTTEEKLEEVLEVGMIERSTAETAQHEGYESDIGTVSLAKNKRDALFFSAVGSKGDQVLLLIDIRMLDPDKMQYRKLFNTPMGEILYSDDIPLGAVFLVERL